MWEVISARHMGMISARHTWEVISARHVGSDISQTHGKWYRPDMGSDIGQTWDVMSARHMREVISARNVGSDIGQTCGT
jgi:hypothetical protein